MFADQPDSAAKHTDILVAVIDPTKAIFE